MKIVMGIVIVVVIALAVIFVPIMEVPYTETVQYQDTETYYENEPYEVMELQEVIKPLEYQFLGSGFGGYENLDGNYVFGPHYKLMNRGEVAGHFTIRLVLYTIEKDKYLDLVWKYPQGLPEEVFETNFQKLVIEEVLYLEPRETGEAVWSWEELGVDTEKIEYSGRWEILPDTEMTEEQRTVTKYRQVEKERTVTKERPETRYKRVTLLDYLLHY